MGIDPIVEPTCHTVGPYSWRLDTGKQKSVRRGGEPPLPVSLVDDTARVDVQPVDLHIGFAQRTAKTRSGKGASPRHEGDRDGLLTLTD
jgi:hypothetical protein